MRFRDFDHRRLVGMYLIFRELAAWLWFQERPAGTLDVQLQDPSEGLVNMLTLPRLLLTDRPTVLSCSGLNQYLDKQGFSLVGYGCTTCIGNSGDIAEELGKAITDNGKATIAARTFYSTKPPVLIGSLDKHAVS